MFIYLDGLNSDDVIVTNGMTLYRQTHRVVSNILAGPWEPFKREVAYLADGATEGTGRVFSQ